MSEFNSPKCQRLFKILSYIEGSSLLILLFVAMPLKYFAGDPRFVSVVGMVHGLLFMALVLMIVLVGTAMRWSKGMFCFALVSSSVPFGMFALDYKLRKLSN